jgi:hypothetical protein
MTEEQNKPKAEFKEPGLRGVKTSNAFKIVNFELFAKPVSYSLYSVLEKSQLGPIPTRHGSTRPTLQKYIGLI